MKLSRALQRTILASAAVTVLAFGAAPAKAADNVAYLGHISASVTALLNVQEVAPMKFGNFNITCTAGTCDNKGTIILTPGGTRTAAAGGGNSTITLLNGASQTSPGIAAGNQETGSQSPGFYTIDTGAEAAQNVYITFADNLGNIIDANHPANNVVLNGTGAGTFTVDTFQIAQDDGTTGYVNNNPIGSPDAVYGAYVTTTAGGKATVRVGATLHTVAAVTPVPGNYKNTFYIMASY